MEPTAHESCQSPEQDFRSALQDCKDLFVDAVTQGSSLDEQEFYAIELPDLTSELVQATRPLRKAGDRCGITDVEIEEANMVKMVTTILERNRDQYSIADTLRFIAASIQKSLQVLSDRRPRKSMMELIVDSTTCSANLANVNWETSFFHLPAILKAVCGSTRRPKKKRRGLFAEDLTEDLWKIVYVYILSRLVYDELSRTTFDFCLKELKSRISLLLDRKLRSSRAAESGITLFLVDLFVTTTEEHRELTGLSMDAVMEQLSGNGRGFAALKFVEEATGLHYYAVAACCAERLMLVCKNENKVSENCEKILHSRQDHCTYLQRLEKQEDLVNGVTRNGKRKARGEAEAEQSAFSRFSRLGYPVTIELDVLLSNDKSSEAICTARAVEKNPALDRDEKVVAYGILWDGLLRMGLLFYDRDEIPVELSLGISFVPHAGKIAIDVFARKFHKFSKDVAECQELDEVVRNYVNTISRQALLRMLINRFPISDISEEYAAFVGIPASTPGGISKWAKDFLETTPEIPVGWDRITSIEDILNFLYGDETPAEGSPVEQLAQDTGTGAIGQESPLDVDEVQEVAYYPVGDKGKSGRFEYQEAVADSAAEKNTATGRAILGQTDELRDAYAAKADGPAAEESRLRVQFDNTGRAGEIMGADRDMEEEAASDEDSVEYSDESSQGSGHEEISDEEVGQDANIEVYEIDDSSEESASSRDDQADEAEERSIQPADLCDFSVSDRREEVAQQITDQHQRQVKHSPDERQVSSGLELPYDTQSGDEKAVGEEFTGNTAHEDPVDEADHDDEEDITRQKSPLKPPANDNVLGAAEGNVQREKGDNAYRAQESPSRSMHSAGSIQSSHDDDAEGDLELQEAEDRKMPFVAVAQIETQERLSQDEAGYDAEESQDAATEEEYERPRESLEIRQTHSQAETSIEEGQEDFVSHATDVGIPLDAPVQASVQVDPGYEPEDSHGQTDADGVPKTQIPRAHAEQRILPSEAGYEAEDSQGLTEEEEEEISEAVQTDEEEQRRQTGAVLSESIDTAKGVDLPIRQSDNNTLSDMDAADEDSELEERGICENRRPVELAPYYFASVGQQGQSLQDYAAAAQQMYDDSRLHQAETRRQVQPRTDVATAALSPPRHLSHAAERDIVDHVPEAAPGADLHRQTSDSTATTAGSQQDMSIETRPEAMEAGPDEAALSPPRHLSHAAERDIVDHVPEAALGADLHRQTSDSTATTAGSQQDRSIETRPEAMEAGPDEGGLVQGGAAQIAVASPVQDRDEVDSLCRNEEQQNEARKGVDDARDTTKQVATEVVEGEDKEKTESTHRVSNFGRSPDKIKASSEQDDDAGVGMSGDTDIKAVQQGLKETNQRTSDEQLYPSAEEDSDEDSSVRGHDKTTAAVTGKDDETAIDAGMGPQRATRFATTKGEASPNANSERKNENTQDRVSSGTPQSKASARDHSPSAGLNTRPGRITRSAKKKDEVPPSVINKDKSIPSQDKDSPGTPPRRGKAVKDSRSASASTPSRRSKRIASKKEALNTPERPKNDESDDDERSEDQEPVTKTQRRTRRRAKTTSKDDTSHGTSPARSRRSTRSAAKEEGEVSRTPRRLEKDESVGDSSNDDRKQEKKSTSRATRRAKATAEDDTSVSASTRSRRSTRSATKHQGGEVSRGPRRLAKEKSDDEEGSDGEDQAEKKRRTRQTKVTASDDNTSLSASTRSGRSTRSRSKKGGKASRLSEKLENGESNDEEGNDDQQVKRKRSRLAKAAVKEKNASVSTRSTRSSSRKRKAVEDSDQESQSTRRTTRSKPSGDDSSSRSRRKTRFSDAEDDSSTRAVRSRRARSHQKDEDDDGDDTSMRTRSGRKRAATKPPLPSSSTRSTRSTRKRK